MSILLRPGSSGPSFGNASPQFDQTGSNNFVGAQFGMPPHSPFRNSPGHPIDNFHSPGPIPQGPQSMERFDPSIQMRRPHSYYGQSDYRVHELNKGLQQRTDDSDNLWWDSFANKFFEDDATLTLKLGPEEDSKRYTIGRSLIPRYFRSIFESGVTELYFNLRHSKESFHNTSITLDCDQCTMETLHGKPVYTKVCTEGRLVLEFSFDDLMRIKTWHMTVRAHRELIPKTIVGMHSHASQADPTMLEQLSQNITRQGITNSTLNYLRLCVILEPMQDLMSRQKTYELSPRDCLKTVLFQKWQHMVAPAGKPETQRPAAKRRKRKAPNTNGANNAAPPASNKKRSPAPNLALASQEVMVVSEPSLMGGEFGDEDERFITRLENSQYEGMNSNSMENENQCRYNRHAVSSPLSMPNGQHQQDDSKRSPAISH